MNARKLKLALNQGTWEKAYLKPPEPPEEWGKWRRERMQVAIACAIMYFVGGKEFKDIAKHFGKKGYIKEGISKQAVSQYVNKAIPFLIDRGMFVPSPK